MEPLTFTPIYVERVWGGRELERVYNRTLPDPTIPYGESWEIVDRENDQSVVDFGPRKGISLHELWTTERESIFGYGYEDDPRFPLLIKVLDARNDLSIQVHPPDHLAASLGGEPKTEMWFVADVDPGAKLYVGLKNGVTRDQFESAIASGTVENCVHSITPSRGESIFLPSGRLHAIGVGFLIHEIAQNSDTTYRVFDWNRNGLDGKPRDLHIAKSLACIDFNDFEPTMDTPQGNNLATCPYFSTDHKTLDQGEMISNPTPEAFSIITVVSGCLKSKEGRMFNSGSFLILPRNATPLEAIEPSSVLQISLPNRSF